MSKVITLENLEVFKQECDKAYASKEEIITATVDCSHKYEITGNTGDEHGLAIDDQQMLIKKIQGHSRRKSLNLLKDKSEYVGTVQFSISKSVLTINGTTNLDTTWFGLPVDFLPTNFVFSTFNTSAVTDCDILFMRGGAPIDYIASVPTNSVKKISNIESISIRLNGNGKVFNNVKIPIMINEGTTALPFQPYDNTLVNSNNTLISTGRNLIDINEYAKGRTKQGQTTNVTNYPKLTCSSTEDPRIYSFKTADYYLSLPKGQYKLVIDNLTRVETYSICNIFLPNDVNVGGSKLSVGKNVINLNLETDNIIGIISKMPNSSFNIGLFFKDENNEYEYKQDIVQAPSLGEFDYYQEGKIYRQTSQVVTLNGSEEWDKGQTINSEHWRFNFVHSFSNVYENLNEVTTTSNFKDVNENQTWGGGVNNYGISINAKRIYLCNENFTTVDQLKQWLRQNPIQLVYKLATPAIEDYVMPSGYAVYNGGLQIQQGDVPYTITKQYNLSQKAQILANIEVDREQAKMIDENNQKFNLIPKFSHVDINLPETSMNGTLTQEQLTTLQINDLNYIIFANEIYSLNDKTHTADALTYSHVGFENGKHLLKTISITVSTRAWVLNTTSVVDSYEYRMFKINNPSDNISTSIKEIYIYTNKFDTASRFQDFLQNAYDGDMIFAFSCVAITPTDTIINAQFFYDLNIDPSSYFVIFNDKSEYVAHQNLVVVESA